MPVASAPGPASSGIGSELGLRRLAEGRVVYRPSGHLAIVGSVTMLLGWTLHSVLPLALGPDTPWRGLVAVPVVGPFLAYRGCADARPTDRCAETLYAASVGAVTELVGASLLLAAALAREPWLVPRESTATNGASDGAAIAFEPRRADRPDDGGLVAPDARRVMRPQWGLVIAGATALAAGHLFVGGVGLTLARESPHMAWTVIPLVGPVIAAVAEVVAHPCTSAWLDPLPCILLGAAGVLGAGPQIAGLAMILWGLSHREYWQEPMPSRRTASAAPAVAPMALMGGGGLALSGGF